MVVLLPLNTYNWVRIVKVDAGFPVIRYFHPHFFNNVHKLWDDHPPPRKISREKTEKIRNRFFPASTTLGNRHLNLFVAHCRIRAEINRITI